MSKRVAVSKNTKKESNVNNSDSLNEKKKRGRPAKTPSPKNRDSNLVKSMKVPLLEPEDVTEQETNSIILHLPIYDDNDDLESQTQETSDLNQFTMKETEKSSDNSDNDDSDEDDNKENNLIVYLSEEDENDEFNIKCLKKELSKKNEIIRKLQEEINNRSEHNIELMSANKAINVKKVNSKVVDIESKNQIPEKTKIACWWCTHNFDTVPCGIPEKYHDSKYYVFGCFCSFNCALAYILKDDEHRISMRVSLVKRLYTELCETQKPLYPAPPKEILQKFGGTYTIDEYRKESTCLLAGSPYKEYKMIMAPIDFHFTNE
jgi:hypothetical protein